MSQRIRRPATLAVLALLALSSGCGDSPTGPRPLGAGILAPGAVARGTIQSMSDTARFSLVLNQGTDAMVYLMAKGDWLRLEVRDSTGKLVTTTNDSHNTTAPERRATTVIPSSPYRYHVDVSMVNGTSPSDYEIRVVAASRAPEHVPSSLTVGTILSGEDLDHAYDVDSFTVTVDRAQMVNLYMRKTTRSDARVFAMVSGGPPPGYFLSNTGAGLADTVLGHTGSGRLTLAAGARYMILVYGANTDTTKTPYELLLQPIDTAPEHATATLVPGDTVPESIDVLGDIDDFTLTGTPGAQYNLFVEADGVAPRALSATLAFGNWNDLTVTATEPAAPLAANPTGVFALPPSGTLRIRVYDGQGFGPGNVGPYRLFAYPIDKGVEGTSADITLDQVKRSRIEMPGDVDEFTLAIRADTAVNIEVRRPDEGGGRPLRFTFLSAGDSEITHGILGIGYPAAVDTTALGTRLLQPGTYKLRVEPTSSTRGGFAGDYEIVAHSISTATERVAGTIAIGDTIRAEVLDFPGDIDRFHVSLAAGDSVYVSFGGLQPDVNAKAYVYRASDRSFVGGAEALGAVVGQSRIMTITAPGDYYIEVAGKTGGVQQGEFGPYRLALDRITAAPESGPATIALGDTVSGWIDVPGDVDEFTLAAPAGTEITGWFRDSTGNYYCCIAVEFVDPATGAVLKRSSPYAERLGRVTIPAGGSLRVRAREPYTCDTYGCYGPNIRTWYRLSLTAVNLAPETRGAAFAIGDTVSGEWIDPVADVDEFSFDATAGDTVNVYFQTPSGTWGIEGFTLALIDMTTSATLGTLNAHNPSTNLEDIALTRVVLPSTGRYMVRVTGTSDAYDRGQYRFRVARPGQ